MIIKENHYCSRCMRPTDEGTECPHCGYSEKAASFPFALEERTILKGRYLLGAVIGAGGFGITYAAWDKVLGAPVAIKEYFPRELVSRDLEEGDEVLLLPGDENRALFRIGLDRFLREAQLLAMLSSVPGIVSVHDYFEGNDTAYIVMEYLRGETLGNYYQREKPAYSRLLSMLRQPIDALIACHGQGILHRDISPDNLFVLEDGTVKLIDFGAAARMERRAMGKDQSVLLRRSFAPVEQYEVKGNQGPWTDVYALCATLYALLNASPAPDAPLRQHHAALPGLSALPIKKDQKKTLEKGMAVQPESRIQSMEELRSLLYHLPLPEEVKRRKRFMRRMVFAVSVTMLLFALILINATTGFYLGRGFLCTVGVDGLTIQKYQGQEKDLAIPSSLLALPVARIDGGAFQGNEQLETVIFPASLKNIGTSAFQNCTALRTIDLRSANPEIASLAFANCSSLLEVFLHDDAAAIHATAFQDCQERMILYAERGSAAQSTANTLKIRFTDPDEFFYFPGDNENEACIMDYWSDVPFDGIIPHTLDGKPVVSISLFAMRQQSWGHTIDRLCLPEYLRDTLDFVEEDLLSEMNTVSQVEWCNSLQYIGNQSFFYLGQYELDYALFIPPSVQTIGSYAFAGSGAQSLILPEGLGQIEEGAFFSCNRLQFIQLPGSLTHLPQSAFAGCTALEKVEFAEGCLEIGANAFNGCAALSWIYLPESVTSIDTLAFGGCASLSAVYIPAAVEWIAPSAFYGCPKDLLIVGHQGSYAHAFALEYGYSFEAVEDWERSWPGYDAPENWYPVNDGINLIAKVSQTSGLPLYVPTFINRQPVVEIDYLDIQHQEIILPKLLKRIHRLQGTLSGGELLFRSRLESIDAECFSSLRGLKQITLPATIYSIDSNAFYGTGIREFIIPGGVTMLNEGIFTATPLRKITVPGSAALCFGAFRQALHLENAVMEEGVSHLYSTFQDCVNLKSVSLPSTLSVVNKPFEGCVSLSRLTIHAADTVNMASLLEGVPPETIQNLTLHALPGGNIQFFAQENGIAFQSLTPDL